MTAPDPAALPLRDIHLPPPVPWWPLAPGWYVLVGSLLLLVALGYWAWRRHRNGRLARAALAELTAIEHAFNTSGDAPACARALSRLARQVVLATPVPGAAAATGDAWFGVLERVQGSPCPPALAAVLSGAAYSPAAAAAIPPEDYQAAMRDLAGLIQRIRVRGGPRVHA